VKEGLAFREKKENGKRGLKGGEGRDRKKNPLGCKGKTFASAIATGGKNRKDRNKGGGGHTAKDKQVLSFS